MKQSFLFLLAIPSLAFAANDLVLTRSYQNGLVAPHLRLSERCSLDMTRSIITKDQTVGTVQVHSAQPFTATGGAVAEAEAAARGKITTSPAPTDGPTTVHELTLDGKRTGLLAQGTYRYSNSAAEAQSLVNLLDVLCGPIVNR